MFQELVMGFCAVSQNNLNQMFWNASVGKVIWHTSAMWAFVFGNKRIKEKSKKFPEN